MGKRVRIEDAGGFTLIELMIVIAVIGILAAIAIPNFIAYRNKSYCSATESDADKIANAVGEYFSIPTNQSVSTAALTGANITAKTYISVDLSNLNTWRIIGPTAPSTAITIQVTDISTRCPDDYQAAMTQANDSRSFWSRTVPGVYTKVIRP